MVAQHLAHPPDALVQCAVLAVTHQAPGVLERLRVVVEAQAAVRGEAGGDRLPAAVHRDLVDVGVHDQIGVGRPLVDLEDLALVGRPDHGQVVVVLGVVLVEHAARLEGVVDAVAEHVPQLVLVHAAMQAEGGDDVDVVDPGLGGEVEHRLDDPLTVVGPAHLRQRQAGVVEHDRQLHVGVQQRRQRVHVDRVEQARCGSRRRGRRCRPAARVGRSHGCGRRAASRG